MTLGLAPRQGDLLTTTANYCEGRVAADSIYGVLHRECFRLFPDEMFADLFTDVGRRSDRSTVGLGRFEPRSGRWRSLWCWRRCCLCTREVVKSPLAAGR